MLLVIEFQISKQHLRHFSEIHLTISHFKYSDKPFFHLFNTPQSAYVQKQIHHDYKNKLKALEEEKEGYRSQFALVVGEREGLQIELDNWK